MLSPLIIFIVVVSLQTLTSVAQQAKDLPTLSNHHHNNDSSSFLYQSLQENQHRIGFEAFFWLTNSFLDNYFPPYIPNELFKSRGWSLSDLVNVYMPDETSDQPAVVYSKLVRELFGYLNIFLKLNKQFYFVTPIAI